MGAASTQRCRRHNRRSLYGRLPRRLWSGRADRACLLLRRVTDGTRYPCGIDRQPRHRMDRTKISCQSRRTRAVRRLHGLHDRARCHFRTYQGPAETGPRALGHRSILANPCNPTTRENLNARVKYREAIRPLAPLMTLDAAKQFFELSDGASDADYNAYNYMV